jgi:hypothetical protein
VLGTFLRVLRGLQRDIELRNETLAGVRRAASGGKGKGQLAQALDLAVCLSPSDFIVLVSLARLLLLTVRPVQLLGELQTLLYISSAFYLPTTCSTSTPLQQLIKLQRADPLVVRHAGLCSLSESLAVGARLQSRNL